MNRTGLWLMSALVFCVLTVLVTTALWTLVTTGFLSDCRALADAAAVARCAAGAPADVDRAALFVGVFGTAVSAIATVALLVTIVFTSRATDAAVEAALSAKEAVRLARDGMLLELRPYLTVASVEMKRAFDSSGALAEIYFQLDWHNVGATPALKVTATANNMVCDGVLPSSFAFPPRPGNNAAGTLGQDKRVFSSAPSLPLDDLRRVLRREATLHLWGVAEYAGMGSQSRFRTEYYVTCTLWNAAAIESDDLKLTWYIREQHNNVS